MYAVRQHTEVSHDCLYVPTQDKENLEDAVRKQHDLIEKQSEELKSLRSKLEEQDKELNAARWGRAYLQKLRT